jgi:DNA mismatch endonuclease (patch repair protein)
MLVRQTLSALGYRYRVHADELPGRPDVVFSSRKKAVFVHGCFWHRHRGCGRVPKSNLDFWLPKLEQNRLRDVRVRRELRRIGWTALVVWECQIRSSDLPFRLLTFLEG